MNSELIEFIIRAKVSGYASGTKSRKMSFDDNSMGFEFKNHQYKYIDRYYGFNPFSGTEHVYNNHDALIWKMNYFGSVSPSYPSPHEIYIFLKEAMLLISPEYPFRGPRTLDNGELIYTNDQHITPLGFYGIESIHRDSKKVFELYYHGGGMSNE